MSASDMRFFGYHAPTGEFQLFATLEEARDWVKEGLEADEDEAAADGWDEAVVDSCYGALVGGIVETSRRPREDVELTGDAQADEIIEYGLKVF